MNIFFAGDHAGFEMKGKLIDFVRGLGHEVEDLGPFSYNAADDFPDFVIPLAKRVASYSPFPKGSTQQGEGFKSSVPHFVGKVGDGGFIPPNKGGCLGGPLPTHRKFRKYHPRRFCIHAFGLKRFQFCIYRAK